MFQTRKTKIRIIAPLALAGALLVTGCSTSASDPAADNSVSAVEELQADVVVGTGKTSMEDINWGSIDSTDAEFNAGVEELVLALNAASPGGLSEVNINAHGPERVEINLLTDTEDGTINASQVTAMIDTIAGWTLRDDVDQITLGGFNRNFGAGEILSAATEAGVNAEYIDEFLKKINIPKEGLNNVWG